ncbi:response regulator [bacterium]|nr:response regulator [bacterium]
MEKIRSLSGDIFFSETSKLIGEITKANSVWIGELSKNREKITTLSYYQNGVEGANFEYFINNTLCETVLESKKALMIDSEEKNLKQNSNNLFFKKWTISNYIGVPLFNSKKEVIGVIVTIFSQNSEQIYKYKLFIEIISSFCSQELESIERKREFKYQEQRFYDLFNSTPISIWELDASLFKKEMEMIDLSLLDETGVFNIIQLIKITAINNYTLSMFKIDSKKNFIKKLSTLLTDDFIKKTVKSFELLKNNISSYEFESTLKNSLNETINILIKWEISSFSNDSWDKIIIVLQDITDKKNYELRLRQSEKMEAVGMLAGGVAHDFNNQLTAIFSFAEILKEDLKDSQQIKYVDNILSASTRASDLIDQLLMFSRKGEALFISIDIDNIISETIELLERSIDKKIVLKHEKSDLITPILGDSTMLQNMLLNLVINARDAMPNGGEILIKTDTINIDDKSSSFIEKEIINFGEYVKLTIKDNGLGIDKKILNNIFSPFFTTKEPGKGTGLGLSAVYGTVKKHNGFIKVESELGIGTTFNIFFPTNRNLSPKIIEQKNGSKVFPKKSYTILLIDDEELVYKATSEILKRVGYSVMICTNGEDAMDYFNRYESSIDLIILDMIMPVMSGKEVFSLIREHNKTIPIIFSSGYPIDKEELLGYGKNVSFIQKPFKISELSEKIVEIFN